MEEISPPIFLSYAKVDVARAREVYRWLTRGGLDCWMDEVYLRVGQDWKREIDKIIRTCQIFVACLSSNAVDHPRVLPDRAAHRIRGLENSSAATRVSIAGSAG